MNAAIEITIEPNEVKQLKKVLEFVSRMGVEYVGLENLANGIHKECETNDVIFTARKLLKQIES